MSAPPSFPPVAERRKLGIYYTPSVAASQIAIWAIRASEDLVLEPSFGGCALLSAAIDRLRQLGCQAPEHQLLGYDIDPTAFEHLRQLLHSYAAEAFALQDFLSAPPKPASVDVVLANPPFIGYRNLSAEQKKAVHQWRSTHGAFFPANAGLWAYFLAHSLNYLRDDGRLAYLLPGTLASADYASTLLSHLRWHFRSVEVIDPQERLFLSAGTSERAAILLCQGYSASKLDAQCDVTWLHQDRLLIPAISSSMGKKSVTPRVQLDGVRLRQESIATLASLHSSGQAVTLGTRAKPLIGEVLGDARFFVKTLAEWQQHGIDRKDLRPILRRLSDCNDRIVIATDTSMSASFPQLLRPDSEPLSKAVSTYLDRYDRTRRDNNVTFGKRAFWWQVTHDTSASAFIASVSNHDAHIVLNEAGITCSNSVYKLFGLPGVWKGRQEALASLSTLSQLSAELLSRSLGGGGLKLEPSDVRLVLLPRSVDTVSNDAAKRLSVRVEAALKEGRREEARTLVDDAFLVESECLTRSELSQLHRMLMGLRKRRRNRG